MSAKGADKVRREKEAKMVASAHFIDKVFGFDKLGGTTGSCTKWVRENMDMCMEKYGYAIDSQEQVITAMEIQKGSYADKRLRAFAAATGQSEAFADPNAAGVFLDSLRTDDAQCDACGKGSMTLLRCKKCKLARYCNADCQKKHWRLHKKECQEPKKGSHK